MRLFFDSVNFKEGSICLIGWAAPDEKSHGISLSVLTEGREPVDGAEVVYCLRPDIGYALFHDPSVKKLGIYAKFPCRKNGRFVIRLAETEGDRILKTEDHAFGVQYLLTRMKLKQMRADMQGSIDFGKKLMGSLTKSGDRKYRQWFLTLRASEAELMRQRSEAFPDGPLFSILTPVYRTPVRFLNEMIDSVLGQSYTKFELILANADPSDRAVSETLSKRAASDSRIRVLTLSENKGISGNSNEAFAAAKGDYIALLDHDDILEKDALYQYAVRLKAEPETDVLYSDEDKITEDSDAYFFPYFKSDYNPDLLLCNNYICHFLAVRRSLVSDVGGWDPAFDGAQDHELLLRLSEKTVHFAHIPRILYHWRSYAASTAKSHENKAYAKNAGVRALEAYYSRNGVAAEVTEGSVPGCYVTKRKLRTEPLVSILIPNRNHADDLKKCIASLYHVNTYRNFEILIVENGSTEQSVLDFYREAERQYENLRVLRWTEGFNFSAINNFAASHAKGDYYLLLNNDVEVISPDFLYGMLSYAVRDNTGAVGCRLLYPDDTVQHAGVLVGAGGLASHMFKGLKASDPGYFARAVMTQDLSAVTAACLLVSKAVYDEVGGLDEAYQVAFNDVDFCLKIRERGYRVVYDAEAVLYHYESKSRGMEDTPAKLIRAGEEMDLLNTRWHIRQQGDSVYTDPYYNPNLSYLHFFEPDYRKTAY